MIKTRLSFVSTAACIMLAGCATHISTPFSPPQPFDAEQYCSTSGSSQTLVVPPEIIAVIEDEQNKANNDTLADALLTKAALEIAFAAADTTSCLKTFEQGQNRFLKVIKSKQNTLAKLGDFKPSNNPVILNIQTEITRHWREDQSSRGAYLSLATQDKNGAPFWAQRLSTAHSLRVDGRSKAYIEQLVDDYQWIDIKRFGNKVSDHAWILVQHADRDPKFQSHVLEAMGPYLKKGTIKAANYAFLWDRVAVNTGRKQRYGTQPTWECKDGKLQLQPMEDPDNVNKRRAQMKMNSVEQGLQQMAQGVC